MLSVLYSIDILDCLETNSHLEALACVKSKCENVKQWYFFQLKAESVAHCIIIQSPLTWLQ